MAALLLWGTSAYAETAPAGEPDATLPVITPTPVLVEPEAAVVAPPVVAPPVVAPAVAGEPLSVGGEAVINPLPPDGCQGVQRDDPRWFDRAQNYFSQRACVPAIWFDRFFGEDRGEEVASALVRVTPSLQYSDRDFTQLAVRIKARVNLPNLKDRVNLVVNDDPDESSALLPGEVARPARVSTAERENSAALRYLVKVADTKRVDIDVGLRSHLKFFARLRYRHLWTHTPVLQTRYTQSLFFRDGDGFGDISLVEVERMLAEDVLLRWSTQATVSEVVNGLELRDGIQLLYQIDRDRAINWNLAMTINSDPVWKANSYVTSIRYRQRIFRPWFFYEVEPFVDWIREDHFNTNPGIAFRVEMLFGDMGNGRRNPAEEVPAEENHAEESAAVTSPTNDAPIGEPSANQ